MTEISKVLKEINRELTRLEEKFFSPPFLTMNGIQYLPRANTDQDCKSRVYNFFRTIDVPLSWIFEIVNPKQIDNSNYVHIYFVSDYIKDIVKIRFSNYIKHVSSSYSIELT
jgi:hypothetical protein